MDQTEGAEPVIVPDIERFGEKDETTGQQNWEDVPVGSALEGLLLPKPPGKEYRLLKVVTQPATPDQISRLGNDRVPILHQSAGGTVTANDLTKPSEVQPAREEQTELFG